MTAVQRHLRLAYHLAQEKLLNETAHEKFADQSVIQPVFAEAIETIGSQRPVVATNPIPLIWLK